MIIISITLNETASLSFPKAVAIPMKTKFNNANKIIAILAVFNTILFKTPTDNCSYYFNSED